MALQTTSVTVLPVNRSIAVRVVHGIALSTTLALAICVSVLVTSAGMRAQVGLLFPLLSLVAEFIACGFVLRISLRARVAADSDRPERAVSQLDEVKARETRASSLPQCERADFA